MADPFVGEVRMFGGNFAPVGWVFCNGQLLAVSEYETLYALLGTTYGGDGVTTFGVPSLVGRLPLNAGTRPGASTYILGQVGGQETVTLISQQLPPHPHAFNAVSTMASQTTPSGNLVAGGGSNLYATAQSGAAMGPQAIGPAGGGQPHENMMPFLAVSFIISLFGIFPSQN